MKLCLFFLQNGVGGAEKMTINIAKLLPSDKYQIIICKVTQPYIIQNGRIDDFIPKNFKVTNITWTNQISFLIQLYRIISRYKPDIVFSSVMPYNQRILLLQPLFKKIKFIVRNDNYLFTLNKLKRLTLSFTYQRATSIIAQTEEMGDELIKIGIPANKIKVLHNFIEEETINKKASDLSPFPKDSKVRFVSVGRFAYQKGFDVLIKAFRDVIKSIPDSELYIIGSFESGEQNIYSELVNLVDDLNLKNKVIFTGYTENPYKFIKNASVYVLSSRYEGLPNVLIEAQYLKTPTAATSCIPIISRIVQNGYNGYLAITEDPKSLSKAMIESSKLKSVKQTYIPSSKEDFLNIFEH